jgi:hypothetical protein
MTVRPACATDLSAIGTLYTAMLAEHPEPYPALGARGIEEFCFTVASDLFWNAPALHLIATLADIPVGYIGGRVATRDIGTPKTFILGTWLFVQPAAGPGL